MLDHYGLRQRAVLIQAIRQFFFQHQYLEVDTPIRIPAPAPESYIEPEISGDWFLQASPELCMKRLLAAGNERIFQICKCFRRAERGARHLPEFTMLEWYRAGIGYRELMEECEELLGFLAARLGDGEGLTSAGQRCSFVRPWERVTVEEAFARCGPLSMREALRQDLFEEIMVRHIEPQLGKDRPTFIYDYPAELGALARIKPEQPGVAERFELYVAGLELANGFSELTDAVEQRARFEEAQRHIRQASRHAGPMPEAFLAELPGMPEAGGIALGVDRLAMLFLGKNRIDEAVSFIPEEL